MPKVLLAIKGNEDEGWLGRVVGVTGLRSAERVLLVHVVDTEPRHDLALGRERYLGRRRLGEDRLEELTRVEEESAAATLESARADLRSAGIPDERLDVVVLHGKPNETIRELAVRERFDLIVVAGRSERPGPHSLGKTARFLIDHAPVAGMMVR